MIDAYINMENLDKKGDVAYQAENLLNPQRERGVEGDGG